VVILQGVIGLQKITSQPVQFEITQPTRDAVSEWIREAELGQDDYLFPLCIHDSPHIVTPHRGLWVTKIGLNPSEHGTH